MGPLSEQRSSSVQMTLSARTAVPVVEERLPKTARQLLQLLRIHRRLSTGDMIAISGRSRPTVLRHFKMLETAGLVKWVGNSLHDPQAYWILSRQQPLKPLICSLNNSKIVTVARKPCSRAQLVTCCNACMIVFPLGWASGGLLSIDRGGDPPWRVPPLRESDPRRSTGRRRPRTAECR